MLYLIHPKFQSVKCNIPFNTAAKNQTTAVSIVKAKATTIATAISATYSTTLRSSTIKIIIAFKTSGAPVSVIFQTNSQYAGVNQQKMPHQNIKAGYQRTFIPLNLIFILNPFNTIKCITYNTIKVKFYMKT